MANGAARSYIPKINVNVGGESLNTILILAALGVSGFLAWLLFKKKKAETAWIPVLISKVTSPSLDSIPGLSQGWMAVLNSTTQASLAAGVISQGWLPVLSYVTNDLVYRSIISQGWLPVFNYVLNAPVLTRAGTVAVAQALTLAPGDSIGWSVALYVGETPYYPNRMLNIGEEWAVVLPAGTTVADYRCTIFLADGGMEYRDIPDVPMNDGYIYTFNWNSQILSWSPI